MKKFDWMVLALSLSAPFSAKAFNQSHVGNDDSGPGLRWCSRNVSYIINENGSKDAGAAAFEAVNLSFEQWTLPDCTDFRFNNLGTTPSFVIGLDDKNLVVWREKTCDKATSLSDPCFKNGGCGNKYNCWQHSDGTIALTTTTFSSKTGEIFDADIEFNGADFVFSTNDGKACENPPPRPAVDCVATDIRNTLTHEVGHLIGMDHSAYSYAVMYPQAGLGELNKRLLSADDKNGVCFIYPAGLAVPECVNAGADDPRTHPVSVKAEGCNESTSQVIPSLALISPLAFWFTAKKKKRNV